MKALDHVAILDRDVWLEKIISKEKTIESRWSVHRVVPWDIVHPGDTLYLKVAGKPVTAKASVEKVLQFEHLDEKMIEGIIGKYGKKICASTNDFYWSKGKNYCTLIFLKDAQRIEPFNIDKSGFGISSAWMYVKDIGYVRKK